MKKKTSFLLRVALSILLIVFIFYKIDLTKTKDVLISSSLFYILLGLLLYITSLIVGAVNILVLINKSNRKPKFLNLLQCYLISTAFGQFIPGRLGDLSLAYFLRKEGMNLGEASAVVIVDKAITFVITFLLAVIGFYASFRKNTSITLIFIITALSILLTPILLHSKIRKIIRKYVLRKYSPVFKGFAKTIFSFAKERIYLTLMNAVITSLRLIIGTLLIYVLFMAVGTKIPFTIILVISTVVNIISAIPITISGIGIREGTAIFFYSSLGYQSSIILSAYVLLFFIRYLITSIILTANLVKDKSEKNIRLL